jgi:hypothetical protein
MLEGETTALVTAVEPVDKITPLRSGTKIEVVSFKVSFTYTVNNKTFEGIEYIPNTLKNLDLIKRLLDKEASREFDARFDPKTPSKCELE